MTIVTDWQDEQPTAQELALRDEAVRLCRMTGDCEKAQAGGSEGVAYRVRDRISWAINRPSAIARGWATLDEPRRRWRPTLAGMLARCNLAAPLPKERELMPGPPVGREII